MRPTVPIILCGGTGTRLWPLSRSGLPKPLQPWLGEQTPLSSLATLLRSIDIVTDPIVVGSHQHIAEISAQLTAAGVSPRLIIAEPEGRNTAPAVLAAAATADPFDVLWMIPADLHIADPESLKTALQPALWGAKKGSLVLFGIPPTRPDTGYGYIQASTGIQPIAWVERFVEKPDRKQAEEMVSSGEYLWNSGMVVGTPYSFLVDSDRLVPGLSKAVKETMPPVDGPILHLDASFAELPSISFDHGVLEKHERVQVVRLESGWSDLGTWDSIWEHTEHDPSGNALVGEVMVEEVSNSYIRSESRLVSVVGVSDLVVVETPDAVLVAPRTASGQVKGMVEKMDQAGRPEVHFHQAE